MQHEEDLVGGSAEPESADDEHEAGEDGADDAPNPVGLFDFRAVFAHVLVHDDFEDGVQDDLDC